MIDELTRLYISLQTSLFIYLAASASNIKRGSFTCRFVSQGGRRRGDITSHDTRTILSTHPQPSVHPRRGTIWRTAAIRCARKNTDLTQPGASHQSNPCAHIYRCNFDGVRVELSYSGCWRQRPGSAPCPSPDIWLRSLKLRCESP